MRITGDMPLDVMLSVMRDEDMPLALRIEMAKEAAPYCHPELAAIEHGGKVDLGLGARLEAATKRDEDARVNGKDRALGHPPP